MKRHVSSLVLSKLGDALESKKMRPEELAVKTGLSMDTIRNAKRKKAVSFSTASSIAKGLGLTREDLI